MSPHRPTIAAASSPPTPTPTLSAATTFLKSGSAGAASITYAYTMAAAAAEVAANASSNLSAGGVNDPRVWAQRLHLRQTVAIARAFAAEFGPAALFSSLRPVYGSYQLSWADADAALGWMNSTLGLVPSQFIWSIAVNAYCVVAAPPGTSPDDLYSFWMAESDAQRVHRVASAAVAVKWGLHLSTYEGSLVGLGYDNATTSMIIGVSREEGYGRVMKYDYLVNWVGIGGTIPARAGEGATGMVGVMAEYNYFGLSSIYGPSSPEVFQWGLTEDLRNVSTAKMRAAAAEAG